MIMLSFVAGSSESQISVDQVTLYSSNVKGILRYMLGGGGGRACMHRSQNLFSEKNYIQHFAPFNLLCLSLAFI